MLKAQKNCLRCVYRSLRAQGTLAFDISQIETGKPESSWCVDRRQISETQEVVRTIFSRRDPQTNVVSVDLFFDTYAKGVLKDRYYEHGEARVLLKDEVEARLCGLGFDVLNVYGDFAKSPRGIVIPYLERRCFASCSKSFRSEPSPMHHFMVWMVT